MVGHTEANSVTHTVILSSFAKRLKYLRLSPYLMSNFHKIKDLTSSFTHQIILNKFGKVICYINLVTDRACVRNLDLRCGLFYFHI